MCICISRDLILGDIPSKGAPIWWQMAFKHTCVPNDCSHNANSLEWWKESQWTVGSKINTESRISNTLTGDIKETVHV